MLSQFIYRAEFYFRKVHHFQILITFQGQPIRQLQKLLPFQIFLHFTSSGNAEHQAVVLTNDNGRVPI